MPHRLTKTFHSLRVAAFALAQNLIDVYFSRVLQLRLQTTVAIYRWAVAWRRSNLITIYIWQVAGAKSTICTIQTTSMHRVCFSIMTTKHHMVCVAIWLLLRFLALGHPQMGTWTKSHCLAHNLYDWLRHRALWLKRVLLRESFEINPQFEDGYQHWDRSLPKTHRVEKRVGVP